MTSWSRTFLGIPWTREDNGRAGTHCWGLVRLVYGEQLGIDIRDYGAAPDRKAVADLMARDLSDWPWRRIEDDEDRQPFDLVIIERAGIDDHVGIIVTPCLMLHLPQGLPGGSLITSLSDPRWSRRIVAHHRHQGLA